MDTDTEPPTSAMPSDERKRPGRPKNTGTETQQQKIDRLQDELRQAQAALKVSEDKRAAIVGAAALRHIRRHTEFARHLAAMLRAEVKSKADRASIADLLNDDTPAPPPA